MNSYKNRLSIILFIIIWITLILYIFLLRSNYLIFWGILISSAVLILIQILHSNEKNIQSIIYIEIISLFIGLQLINIAYAGLNNFFWLDAYYEIAATRSIVQNGWNPTILGSVGPYPAIHIITANLWEITGIGLIDIARWMGLFFHTLALIFYLMLVKTIFQNRKITLLSGLGFVFLFYYVMNSGFGRMPLSMGLFFLTLFLIAKYNQFGKVNFFLLSNLCLITLIFAHIFTTTILIIFIGILLIMHRFFQWGKSCSLKPFNRIKKIRLPNLRKSSLSLFLLLAFISLISHSIYISSWSQKSVFLKVIQILKGIEPSSSIGTASHLQINWIIFLYGQAIICLFFTFLFLKNKKCRSDFYNLFFLLLAGFLGCCALICYYFGIELIRFTLFIWPFLLIPIAYFIYFSRHKAISSLLILAIILVNICGYYTFTYDESVEHNFSNGEWKRYITEQEKLAVKNFGVQKIENKNCYTDKNGNLYTQKIVGNYYFNQGFLYYENIQISIDTTGNFYSKGYKNPDIDTFFYLSKEDRLRVFARGGKLFNVSDELYSNYQNMPSMSRLYDNGEVEVFKIYTTPVIR